MSWVLTHRSSVMKMPYRFALQTNPTQVLYKDGSSPTILACDKLTSPFSIRREVTIPEDWRPGTRHAPVVATFLMIVRKYLTNSKGRLSSSFIHPYISVVPVHPAAEGVVARKQRDDGVRNHIAPPPQFTLPVTYFLQLSKQCCIWRLSIQCVRLWGIFHIHSLIVHNKYFTKRNQC